MSNRKTTDSFSVDPGVLDQLRNLARSRGISKAQAIRDAIDQYLRKAQEASDNGARHDLSTCCQ